MVWEAWRRFKSLYKYKSCRYTASHSFVLVPNGRPIIWRLRTQTSLPRIKKINFKPRDSYIIFHVSHICNPVSFLFVSNVDTVFLYISKSLQTTKPRMLGIHHAIEIDVCPQRGNSMENAQCIHAPGVICSHKLFVWRLREENVHKFRHSPRLDGFQLALPVEPQDRYCCHCHNNCRSDQKYHEKYCLDIGGIIFSGNPSVQMLLHFNAVIKPLHRRCVDLENQNAHKIT